MSVYRVDDLSISIAGTPLVRGISFAIEQGECVAFVGESGSGKSLTCMTPFGLSPGLSTGSAMLGRSQLCGMTETSLRPLRAARVGFVFQQPLTALTPHLTVGRQLTEAARQAGGKQPRRAALIDMLVRVGIDDAEDKLNRYPHQLSGGQRQRVMIAAAIAHGPDLLIADEPTTALDASLRRGIMILLDELRAERGLAVLLVSHDLHSVAGHVDKIIVMRGGEMIESGKTVLTAPQSDYARQLIAATPRLDTTPLPKPATAGILLEASNICVSYPAGGWQRRRITAVADVSLSIAAGEAVAIVGESGSGKSTLARAIARLGPVDRGEVRWLGKLLPARANMKIEHRRLMQPVFQDPAASLDPQWRIADIVAEPLRAIRPYLTKSDRIALVMQALDEVELTPLTADQFPRNLSGGQAQRVAIARALIAGPALLIMDEATSALDVIVAAQIAALLQQLQRDRGLAILAVTHDLALARQLCHRIVVLDRGVAVETGWADDIIISPAHPVTKRLVNASR